MTLFILSAFTQSVRLPNAGSGRQGGRDFHPSLDTGALLFQAAHTRRASDSQAGFPKIAAVEASTFAFTRKSWPAPKGGVYQQRQATQTGMVRTRRRILDSG